VFVEEKEKETQAQSCVKIRLSAVMRSAVMHTLEYVLRSTPLVKVTVEARGTLWFIHTSFFTSVLVQQALSQT
jgi:hypothetical protein